MEDDLLSEIQPPRTAATRALNLLVRVWSRVVSPAGARLFAPAVAVVAVYVLWRLWRLAGMSALGRAVRWHTVFTLIAVTAGLSVYLLALPPEDPVDAAEARASAVEGAGRPVYPEPLVIAGAVAVALTSYAALRAAWVWRVPPQDQVTALDQWRRWHAHAGRRLLVGAAALSGGTALIGVGLIGAGSLAAPSVPAPPAGNGALWVGTPRGAARLTPTGWEPVRRPWAPLPADAVHDIAAGSDGAVWLATSGGLLRVGADGSYVRAMVENAPLPYPTVLGLSIDRRGIAWAATVAGAAGVDQARDGRAFSGKNAPLMHQLLDAAYVDRRGHVWFGGAGGVNVYEPPLNWSLPGRWPAGFNRQSSNGGLPGSVVYAILEDSKGRMWFGTDAGVAALVPDLAAHALGTDQPSRWTTFTSATTPGLVQDKVHAIAEDAAGRLYFGTEKGVAIYEESGSGARWSAVPGDRLPHPHVEAIAISPDGRVWLGTMSGLAVYDPSTPTADLPVYRSHPIRHWTSLLWPPHSRLDLPASEITALVWVP